MLARLIGKEDRRTHQAADGGAGAGALAIDAGRREPTVMPPARPRLIEAGPSVGQYMLHLSADLKAYAKAETAHTVSSANHAEVQRLCRLQARLKARWLATALDMAVADRPVAQDGDLRNLERARLAYEEVERALTAVRDAIASGELALGGLRGD